MPKETYIPILLSLFRQYGYDGATLSKISAATGLGKASLYHHFPGGKDDMVKAVLDHAQSWRQQNVQLPLSSEGTPQERLQKMSDRIYELYEGGDQPCILAILHAGSSRDVFHEQIKQVVTDWISAIAEVLKEAGLEDTLAQQRGQDALIAIQGSLIVSQALDDPSLFLRTIEQLPQMLLGSSD